MSEVIDVHAHLLLPDLHAEVGRAAPEQVEAAAALELRRQGQASIDTGAKMFADIFGKLTDLDTRLSDMDRQGVDRQWLSPSPTHYYPWAEEGLAVWIAKEVNHRIAEYVAQRPDRLTGFGLVPLQHPDRIVECVNDAILGRGLAGIEISSFAGDVELSDERLDPFWARMEELGAVVFLHPLGCSLDERLDRYYLSNSVGQPVEHAVAISHLIFGGVLDRFPKLKVVAAHGGGYLPHYIGRADHAWRVRPESRTCEHEPSSYLPKLWYDTCVHDSGTLRALVEIVGDSQVVIGTDYPFDMAIDEPVKELKAAGLPDESVERILGANAAALLKN